MQAIKPMSQRQANCINDRMLTVHEISVLSPCPQCQLRQVMRQKWGLSSRKINQVLYDLLNKKVCRKSGRELPAILRLDQYSRLVISE